MQIIITRASFCHISVNKYLEFLTVEMLLMEPLYAVCDAFLQDRKMCWLVHLTNTV